jgi:hypothetical protein
MNQRDKRYVAYLLSFIGLAFTIVIAGVLSIDDTSEFQPLDKNIEISDRIANVESRVARSIRYIEF